MTAFRYVLSESPLVVLQLVRVCIVCVQLVVCVAARCIHRFSLARQWGGANVTLSEKAKPTDCGQVSGEL